MYVSFIKPAIDRVGALILAVLTIPVTLPVILILLFISRGRVIFYQERIGYHEKRFTVYKFKTLRDIRDSSGNMLPDRQRTFPFGTFLRRFHIDELPQLFCILKGDMSFIGPRPLLPEYLPYYTSEQKQRHEVKPGLAGLSQVQGGNALEWDIRLKLDSYYAQHVCGGLDLRIFMKSIRNFFSGRMRKSSAIFSEHFVEYVKRKAVRK